MRADNLELKELLSVQVYIPGLGQPRYPLPQTD